MSNNIDLHGIILQQAETISKLSQQLAAFVLNPKLEPKQVCTYDPNLKGSDLVREHFRRGGGTIDCLRSDASDEHAIRHCVVNDVERIGRSGKFISSAGMPWNYAVACDKSGRVLTASELLGDI